MSSLTAGQQIYQLIEELYPICRSITGDGLRQSLAILGKHIPMELHEVPSGTAVLDWTVPREWNIREAYIQNTSGERIVDFKDSNLHILNYSVPIRKTVKLDELKEHLFSLPEHEDWIPYRTSYYKENWGFCIPHRLLKRLKDEDYEVVIDSSLVNGSLTYGEYYLRGEIEDEFLISCHCCHPSLCNDNLSGMGLAVQLAKNLSERKLRYSYRFLFIPGTIGSITWLAANQDHTTKIKHGLVIACVGDAGKMHYKKSRRGNAEIDRAVVQVLRHSNNEHEIIEFFPYGYDERQYCSPGFNLPVGSLSRTPHGQFPQYHTSADNLEFIKAEYLDDSFNKFLGVIDMIEANKYYQNTHPYGEPQLGRRGLYNLFGGRKDSNQQEMAILWILNLSDGQHSLLDICEKSGIGFSSIKEVADILLKHNLLLELRTGEIENANSQQSQVLTGS
jgi:aminopeptidase-like protein